MKYYRDILQIALPAMAENFLNFLMGMVDSYLVAHLGLVAISGVAIANNIISIFQAIFIALGTAASAILANSYSRKSQEKLAVQVVEVLKLSILLGLFLGIISIFSGKDLLLFLGAEESVALAGGVYLAWVGGGILFLALSLSLGAILRSLGKSRLPMYVSLLSNVLNLLFSSIAVFLFQAGIVGVALGTLFSRLIACLILWQQLPLKLKRPSWKVDMELLALALPAAGERLMMRAGDVVVVTLIVSMGTAVVAGNAIGETLTQFNYMPGMGIATALVILVAQARGRGDSEQVRTLVKSAYWLSLVWMALISGFVFLFGAFLAGLYTQDSQALAAASLVMFYAFCGTPATAGTLMNTALWQGVGNARLPFYATTLGMWLVRVGLASLLTMALGWGLSGVWLATILDNMFRWVFLSRAFAWRGKKV